MGARKRIQSKDRKTQKQQQKQEKRQQQQQTRTVSPSSSSVQAAAAALASVGGCSRRFQYALGLGALAVVVVLCAVSSSTMMRTGMGAGAGAGAGARVPAAAGGKGLGRSSGGDEPGIRASSQSWMRGLKRLGAGIVDSMGLASEEPVETRRRRQVLEGMRFNGVPIQRYPEASTKPRGAEAQEDKEEQQWRRRAEEGEALVAMARRPVLSFNGREPDCLTGACGGVPTAQLLVQARSSSGEVM